MSADPTTSAADANSRTWLEIESLVEEVARLSKEEISAERFYAALLDRAVRALAALGGAVWMKGAEGNWYLQYQINFDAADISAQPQDDPRHLKLLEEVAAGTRAQVFPPQSGAPGVEQPANFTPHLIFASPLAAEGESIGVLEILQRPDASPAAQRGYVQLVEALCELVGEFHQHLELRELRDRATLWGQIDRFSESVHSHLDVRSCSYAVANDSRRLLDCDRVSVAVARGRKMRLAAVSGVDDVDRRANSVRLLEQLVQAVIKTGEPLWYAGDDQDLHPQIENTLHPYLDLSHARALGVVPLRTAAGEKTSPQTVGALIVEQFEAGRGEEGARKVSAVVARHSASALSNAQQYSNLPLLPVLRAVGGLRWFSRFPQLPITIGILTVLAAAIAALSFVPADFRVGARGELQPALRRVVFAPLDGDVEELKISFEAPNNDAAPPPVFVKSDQVLIQLRDSRLDFEQARLQGERKTAAKQLSTVQVTKQATAETDVESRNRLRELAAKESELQELLKSLDAQLEVLADQRMQLSVRSPIAGQVLTWDPEQLLESRPVRRGQALLTVAAVDGDWVLEMRVPDRHAGHVLSAWREQGRDLQVEFKLMSDPSRSHWGRVEKVAPATEIDADGQAAVLVTVAFNRDELAELRPGTTVVANVVCGQRPVGYVWLHDLIDAIRTWILF